MTLPNKSELAGLSRGTVRADQGYNFVQTERCPLPSLVQIQERGMVPIFCPLRFVQGFRCSRCPWARLLPDCHTPWAVPACEVASCCRDFDRHTCQKDREQRDPFVVIQ